MRPWHLALVIGWLTVPLTASADVVKTAGKVDITTPTLSYNGTPPTAQAPTVNSTVDVKSPTLIYSGAPSAPAATANTTVNLTTPTLTYGAP